MRWKNFFPTYLMSLALLLAGSGLAFAGSATLQVSATIPTNHNCSFSSNAPIALDFGALDPLAAANVTRSATISFECKGNKNVPVVYSITDDDGLHEGSPNGNRLKHGTLGGANAFIPYALTLTPTSGSTATKTPVVLTLTGTILATSYSTAFAGAYADTVVITIAP